MNILIIGGGRMGQRHLAGSLKEASSIFLIEPNPEAREICQKIAFENSTIDFRNLNSMNDLSADMQFDLAILSGPASGRLEQFKTLSGYNINNFLLEKPLEQSRTKTQALIKAAKLTKGKVWSNHYRRNLIGFDELAVCNQPLIITVTSGAMGLGCNGIHWIDFALYLTGQTSGNLLFGEVEELPIGSGRGTQFRDYGGRGLFAFPDGSRLYLSSTSSSSGPTVFSVLSNNQHWVIDQQTDKAILHRRPENITHSTYLYGKDYITSEISGLEAVDMIARTQKFISEVKNGIEPKFPTLEMVAPAYELLFDLLETSGRKEFQFT